VNLLSVAYGHVFDEKAKNPLSFSRFNRGIIPDSREVGRQREQLLVRLGINQQALFLRLPFVVLLRLGEATELIVPVRFQALSDQAIIGLKCCRQHLIPYVTLIEMWLRMLPYPGIEATPAFYTT
jgi:hypothetical protein